LGGAFAAVAESNFFRPGMIRESMFAKLQILIQDHSS
jgi:hypothetical protein